MNRLSLIMALFLSTASFGFSEEVSQKAPATEKEIALQDEELADAQQGNIASSAESLEDILRSKLWGF